MNAHTRRQPLELGFGWLVYPVLGTIAVIIALASFGCSYAPTAEGEAKREADAKLVEDVSNSATAIATALPPPWNLLAAAGIGVVGTLAAGRIRKGKKGEAQ
jgi:hypothetical protein